MERTEAWNAAWPGYAGMPSPPKADPRWLASASRSRTCSCRAAKAESRAVLPPPASPVRTMIKRPPGRDEP